MNLYNFLASHKQATFYQSTSVLFVVADGVGVRVVGTVLFQ